MAFFYVTIGDAGRAKFKGKLVADGRKDTLVFDCSPETVGAQTITVGSQRTETVGSQTITVGSQRTETVGSQTITVGSQRTETVGGQKINIDFVNSNRFGAEHIFYSINLSNATVTDSKGTNGARTLTFSFGYIRTSGHAPHPSFICKFGKPG